MLSIKNILFKWLWLASLLTVIIINWFNIQSIFGLNVSKSTELWMLIYVFIWTILSDFIPVKFKNWLYYYWNKIKFFGRRTFVFKFRYNIELGSDFSSSSWNLIETKLRSKTPEWKTFSFSKGNSSNNEHIYLNDLIIWFRQWDNGKFGEITLSLEKDNYSLSDLEKDLLFFLQIINAIKEPFTITWTSVSFEINVNKFYTPSYLVEKYSIDQKNLQIKIDNKIIFKKDKDYELLTINWNDIDEAAKHLKNYLRLSL